MRKMRKPVDRAVWMRPGRKVALGFLVAVLAAPLGTLAAAERMPAASVIWISVDGIRPDYLDRAATPFLDRMMAEGVFSRDLIPLFPTLTFPSHVAMATGTAPERHGITGNVIYDSGRDRTYAYPNFPWLLEAEPLWTTATRQGVATAVFGWPLSHRQAGPHAARHFDKAFDRSLTDAQRLERVLDVWREHGADGALRLVMGYLVGPDTTGHRYGPDAAETAAAMADVDVLLASFERDALAAWASWRQPGDVLFLMVTSDHGMRAVHTLVNPRISAGLPARGSPVRRVTGGNITHYFFNRIDDLTTRASTQASILERLRRHAFLTVYERDALPAAWQYRHPRRSGDIVAVAAPGYAFSNRIATETAPASEHGEPLGMHGYCAEDDPQMRTVLFLQCYPLLLGGRDLGAVSADRLHATVAHLLGILPAENARSDGLDISRPHTPTCLQTSEMPADGRFQQSGQAAGAATTTVRQTEIAEQLQ